MYEYHRRAIKTKRAARLVWASFILTSVSVSLTLYITRMISVQAYVDNILYFDVALGIRSVVKFATDLYMYPNFIRSFLYFVEQKRLALKDHDQDFTPSNRLVVYYTLYCWVMNLFASLSSIFVFSYFYSSLNLNTSSQIEEFLFTFTLRTVTWTVNFFTYMGMLYLFHYQGLKALHEKRRAIPRDRLDISLMGELRYTEPLKIDDERSAKKHQSDKDFLQDSQIVHDSSDPLDKSVQGSFTHNLFHSYLAA